MRTGYPIFSARAAAVAASGTGPSEPGTTGTPCFCIRARAAALLPICRITSPEGPMNFSPFSSHRSANSGFSDRKP